MTMLYNASSNKKATNLSVNVDLLRQARNEHINLSATLEHALVELLRKRKRTRWRVENRAAIAAYNERVERRGVFGDNHRRF